MKNIIASILVVIFSISLLYGQPDFRKGYIVKVNGDTLNGYINYQKEALNYERCQFKRFDIAFPVTYKSGKIWAYGITNEKQYYSANVDEKPVFLEYLVKGTISLLYLKKGSPRYFIMDINGSLVELEKEKTTDSKSGKIYQDYKAFLMEKLSAGMTESINSSKLEINSLTSLIGQYNKMQELPYEIPERPKGKSILKDYSLLGTNKISFGLIGGLSINKFSTTTSSKFDYIGKGDFVPVNCPFIRLYLKSKIARYIPDLSVKLSLNYQKVSFYGFSKYTIDYYYQSINDIYIDFDMIKLYGSFNYSLNISRIRIIPNLGGGFIYKMNDSYYRFGEDYSTLSNTVKTEEYSDLRISRGDYLIFGGLSFEYQLSSARIIGLNLGYEFGSRILRSEKNSSRNSQIGLRGHGNAISLSIGLSL